MRLSRLAFLLCALAILSALGCQDPPLIQTETVTHLDREKMVKRAAIVEREDLVWVFLLSGPETEVEKNKDTFEAFVRSARIDAKYDEQKKEPPVTWKEPAEWQKDPPTSSFLRYAGFRIAAKPKELEVAVTRMPMPKEGFSLLDNIRRWQKQLNQPPMEQLDLDNLPKGVDVKKETIADQPVTWVTIRGLGIHTVSRRPDRVEAAAKNLMPPLQLDKRPKAVGGGGGGGRNPFTYKVPQGWVKQPVGPGRLAVDIYKIPGIGDQAADLTLTPLSGGPAGNVAANLNRWRKEVDLTELSEREAEASAVRLKVAGIDAHYVDLANPASRKAANRTLGVLIPMDDRTWFIKMWGPHDLIGQQKTNFEEFLKSFRLEGR